jgi:glycyl-tRNA synthetase
MPFAAACIGQAFRNEIAPRSGLLRVREFTLAEIEHFLNPNDKSHPKFSSVKDLKIIFYPRENQMNNSGTVTMTVGEALEKGILNNETHAYFVGRTYLFMMEAGIIPSGIRFRQHLSNEMAHYAIDCWDCELLTSYGWIECVGIADRSCYDLQCHANVSKAELIAWESFKTPKIVEVVAMDVNARVFGKEFRQDSKKIQAYLQQLSDEDKLNFQKELDEKGQKEITVEGKQFVIKKEFVKFAKKQEKITGRNYVPSVIEPSFGIGRIIYAILEHAFWQRKEDKPKDKKTQLSRTVLSLSPTIAPFKTVILPLQNDSRFDSFIPKLSKFLSSAGISHRIDDVGQTIGKRYARADDIGIPFAITIDFKSLDDNTVTLRERDSCTQIRAPVEEVVAIISKLIEKEITWEEVRKKYPEQKETASMTVGKTE